MPDPGDHGPKRRGPHESRFCCLLNLARDGSKGTALLTSACGFNTFLKGEQSGFACGLLNNHDDQRDAPVLFPEHPDVLTVSQLKVAI